MVSWRRSSVTSLQQQAPVAQQTPYVAHVRGTVTRNGSDRGLAGSVARADANNSVRPPRGPSQLPVRNRTLETAPPWLNESGCAAGSQPSNAVRLSIVCGN